MAENKKSFLLYCDLIHTVRKLPKDKIGDLFLTILEYVNDENPVIDDMIIDLVFEPIKQQLKRDLVKYERIIGRNRENGAKGGRPKKPKKPNGLSGNPEKPKKADNDTDNVNDNDTDSSYIPELKEFSEYSKTITIYHPSMDFQIQAKYNSWKENKWKDGNNKQIKNWKTKLQNTMPYFKVDNNGHKPNNTNYKDYEESESPMLKFIREKSRES